MIIRQSLNFAAHLAAGIAFGALAVVAASACLKARNRGSGSSLGDGDAVDAWDRSEAPPPAAS